MTSQWKAWKCDLCVSMSVTTAVHSYGVVHRTTWFQHAMFGKYVYGTGHEGVAVLLPGFAIK